MPELPEVENFARSLSKRYGGKRIVDTRLRRSDIRAPLDRKAILSILAPHARFICATRDGKRLILRTDRGALLVSLGMSGAFLPADPARPGKHEHLTIIFSDDALAYIDPRRFGYIEPYVRALRHLADPLDRKSLSSFFSDPRILPSERRVKDILMDQHLIGGIGNIYALEALHRAGIRPTRRMKTLARPERDALSAALPPLLKNAVRLGGSSVATYRTLHGTRGNFQNLHRVYGRASLPCLRPNCRGTIVRSVHGGRSSFYCPKCQR